MADPAHARAGHKYFKERVCLLGVTTTQGRSLARELFASIKTEWGIKEALRYCDLLLPRKHLEEKGAAILMLGKFIRKAEPRPLLSKVRGWLKAGYLDNWANADSLCLEVISPLLLHHEHFAAETASWSASKDLWLQRASAVSLVHLARRGKCLDLAYGVAERLLDSRENLIHKAGGWLLKEAGKTDQLRLVRFLLKHGRRMSRITLRYALEKTDPALRRSVLSRTSC